MCFLRFLFWSISLAFFFSSSVKCQLICVANQPGKQTDSPQHSLLLLLHVFSCRFTHTFDDLKKEIEGLYLSASEWVCVCACLHTFLIILAAAAAAAPSHFLGHFSPLRFCCLFSPLFSPSCINLPILADLMRSEKVWGQQQQQRWWPVNEYRHGGGRGRNSVQTAAAVDDRWCGHTETGDIFRPFCLPFFCCCRHRNTFWRHFAAFCFSFGELPLCRS